MSAKLFTARLFEIWDILPDQPTPSLDIPRYLQLLTLLSFHVFLEEKVDVAVHETHCGGEFDATNIIRTPAVIGVTSIAMDYVRLLGPTIEKVAWHKAGIFKSGSLAFSTLQEEAITAILQQRAAEKGTVLEFVGLEPTLPTSVAALKPKVEITDSPLALAVVRAWLSVKAPEELRNMKDTVSQDLERFWWPGRYQQINERHYRWFLDGAHDEVSLQYVVQWFAETASQVQK
jgi:folylpolyglutamate synthase